jgi:hypothetical protein
MRNETRSTVLYDIKVLDGVLRLFWVCTVIGARIPYRPVYKLQNDKQIRKCKIIRTVQSEF